MWIEWPRASFYIQVETMLVPVCVSRARLLLSALSVSDFWGFRGNFQNNREPLSNGIDSHVDRDNSAIGLPLVTPNANGKGGNVISKHGNRRTNPG